MDFLLSSFMMNVSLLINLQQSEIIITRENGLLKIRQVKSPKMHLFGTKDPWVFKGRGQSVVKILLISSCLFMVTCHPTEGYRMLSRAGQKFGIRHMLIWNPY